MLETCVSLVDCERVLIEKFQRVKFIGEIELSSEDIRKLTNFINTELDRDPRRGLRLLRQRAPGTIAAFLVWQGIIGYGEGDYWTSALRAIGLDEPRWQQELGEVFISFLRRMDLPDLPIKDALRFVTPILLHGGIPQKCLDQFFDHVIMDMVEFNLVTDDEIRDYLYSLREEEKTRVALRQKLQELKQSESTCRKEAEGLATFIDLRQQAVKLREIVGNPDEWRHIPEDYGTFRLEKLGEIEDINREASRLQSDERLCLDRISAFMQEHEAILQLGPLICVIGVELATVLRDKAELASLQVDEAACMARLQEYAGSIQGEPLWRSSSDETLSKLSADTIDTLNASVETVSELDALKSGMSKLHDEISQVTPQPLKPDSGVWKGLASLPAALCIWLIAGHSPFGLGIAVVLALGGCASVFLGLRRFQGVYRDNKRRKARYYAISKEVSKMQSRIDGCEKTVNSRVEDLPHGLQAIVRTSLKNAGDFSMGPDDSGEGTDDAGGGGVDQLREALHRLKEAVDTFICYHKLLVRKDRLVESIAEWEHTLDGLLSLAGFPGLELKSDEQSRSESELETQDGPEIPGETKSHKRQPNIDDLCDSDSLKSAVELLKRSLDDAIQRSEDSRNARDQLREHIQPGLHGLHRKAEEIKTHIEESDEVVTRLGDGSFEAGISKLKSKYEASRKLKKVNADISRSGQVILRLVDVSGESIDNLLRLCDTRTQALKKLALSIEDTESKLRDYPPAYPYTDEPVQRFVIHGDEWAEKWIIGCVELLELAQKEGDIPGDFRPDLPSRIVQGFKEWWESRKALLQHDGFSYETSRERLSAPKIMLDPIHGDIKIVVDSLKFRFDQADSVQSASLVITAPTRPGWSKTRPLELKRSRVPGLAESRRVECDLPILEETGSSVVSPIARHLPGLAKCYEVSLVIGDSPRETWTVNVFDDKSPCLIFHEDGRLVEWGELPRAKVWFVFPSGWRFARRMRIIEDSTPPYLDHACNIYLVDLTLSDKVVVGDGSGDEFEFRVARDKVSEPCLADGELVHGILIDGNRLYIDEPPCLEIPSSDDTRVGLWDVLIRYGEDPLAEPKRFRLREILQMTGVEIGDGKIRIPLKLPALLGPDPIGGYTVYAIQKDGRRLKASFGFTIVPDFWYKLEPSVVFPVGDGNPRVKLLVSIFEGSQLSVHPPARILSEEEGQYQILVDPLEDTVTGELSFPIKDGELSVFPLQIDVPKVRWRLKEGKEEGDTDWSGHVQEVFIGDLSLSHLLFLQLELPTDIGEVRFSLDDKQDVRVRVKQGKAQANLMQFMDTLRAGGGVGEITGKVFDALGRPVGEGSILSLCWRWEVTEFSCEKENLSGIWRLKFKWKEKGHARDRVLRMWPMWRPWKSPIVWHIPEGETSLTVDVDEDRLPQGAYLIQFDTFDKWSPVDLGLGFPEDGFNAFTIHLHHSVPHVEEWSIHWINEYRAVVTGKVVNIPSGTKVSVRLLGIRCGMACSWGAYGTVNSAERFTVHVRSELESRITRKKARKTRHQRDIKDRNSLKDSARWIGIIAETDPKAHLFAVLPEPGQVEWWFAPKSASPFLMEWPLAEQPREAFLAHGASLLPGLSDQTLPAEISFMEGGPIIRIKCEEGYLEQPDLSRKDSMNVIYKWLKGSRGVDVSVTFGGDMTRMLMSWPETADSLNINVPTGVRCLTCGKFEPDVASWYERHSYKKFPCKGLNITTTKIPASLLVVEELSQIALINLNTYSLAGNHPLTLHSSSIHGALPTKSITGDDTACLTELTRLLLSLEEELISALPGSEIKDGHESY
jgi:hypothetical protein